jgi:hypothetical protein
MTLMGDADALWGGFDVEACSNPQVLAEVTGELAAVLPGIWLHHDDCTLWRVERFRRAFCDRAD